MKCRRVLRPPAAGNGFLDRKKYELNKRAFHTAAALVTWSEWARRSLVDDYAVDSDRVHVISPGAPEAYFAIGRQRVAAPPDDTGRPVRLLFIGGDFRRKGGPELLELMRGPLGHRFTLDVVAQADVAAQPNVRIHRNVTPSSPTLCRLLSEADLFVSADARRLSRRCARGSRGRWVTRRYDADRCAA